MTNGERNITHGISGYVNLKCRCEVCRAAKSARDRKYRLSKGEELLAKKREYHQANRDYLNAKSAEYRRLNPEKVKAGIKAAEAKKPEKYREMKRNKQARLRAAWSEEQREAARRYGAEYDRRNPQRKRDGEARRRARKNGADVREFTDQQWRRMVDRYRGCCHYCGDHTTLTQDHVIPLFRGGRHSTGNIVPACGTCNSSKNDRLIVEWRASKRRAA